jgi:hypothetical protein
VASYRAPLGAYVRNTNDWWQAKQCYAVAYADFTTISPLVIGASETNNNTALVPPGTQINDLLLACFNCANSSQTPTPGTWNLLQAVVGATNNPWFWKYYAKGDPSAFVSSNSLSIMGGNLVTVRGAAVGSNNPFDTMAIGEPDANPMTAPAITGTSMYPELLLLQLGAHIYSKWNSTPGYTELANISDQVSGNSPGMALASTTGTGTFPASTTSFSAPTSNDCGYQQVLIPRAVFSPYASLYNNATDGSVFYVTGLAVDFDAEDQLTIAINQGTDTVPYAVPYGVFSKNAMIQAPPGVLYSGPGSQLIGYVYQSPPTLTHFQRDPADADYIAIIPPGYNLSVTNSNLGAKRMAAYFDYVVLPNAS